MVRVTGNYYRNLYSGVNYNAVLDIVFEDAEDMTEPVTKADVKAYCKINTGTAEDSILDMLITAAREQCEDYTGLSIIQRTVQVVLNNSNGGIFLPYGPVILPITSIKDVDDNAIETDNYTISGTQFPQLISPTDKNITLVYDAGYLIVPERIKLAVLQQVFYLYNNRGETGEKLPTLCDQAKSTLQRLRRVG